MTTISGDLITIGSWTSQLLTNSLGKFRTDFDGFWGILKFKYEAGDANSSVTVDILDSSDAVLASNVTLSQMDNYEYVDLSIYPALRSADIKIKINVSCETVSPIISDLTMSFKDTEVS